MTNSPRAAEAHRILALRPDGEAIAALLAANPSASLPYHGQEHLYSVALRARAGGLHYQDRLPAYSIDELFIAGLFHDYAYSLEATEAENIATAIAAAHMLFSGPRGYRIGQLIAATYFPHQATDTLLQGIIQDADLLQLLEPDYEEVFLPGLAAEKNFTPKADFPGLALLGTTWGRNLYNAHMQTKQPERQNTP
jgi:predicted metal-dependent HD superfamily phosphohydrolase